MDNGILKNYLTGRYNELEFLKKHADHKMLLVIESKQETLNDISNFIDGHQERDFNTMVNDFWKIAREEDVSTIK